MSAARHVLAAALALVPFFASASAPSAELEVSTPVNPGPKNVISVAPFSVMLGSFGAEYERVVSDPISLTFNADYRWMSLDGLDGGGSLATSVVGLNVGAHFFMLGKAPSGLWLGPELGTIVAAGRDQNGSVVAAVPRFAMQVGYTGIIADVLSVSVGAGLQMISVVPLPAARLSLGLAF
jgi:hypothetical protein